METFVCKLIVEGVIPDAKIHRPSQIIYLSPKLSTVDILDQVFFYFLIYLIIPVGIQYPQINWYNK